MTKKGLISNRWECTELKDWHPSKNAFMATTKNQYKILQNAFWQKKPWVKNTKNKKIQWHDHFQGKSPRPQNKPPDK